MPVDGVSGKPTLGLRWVTATAAAAAVAIAAGRPLAELVRAPFSPLLGGAPTVAVFGGIFGLSLGLGQTLAQPRQRVLRAVGWILASTLAGAAGFVLGVAAAAQLTDPLRGRVVVYASEGLGYVIFGAVVGALLGLSEWPAWRRRAAGGGLGRWIWWVGLSAFGWALGFAVTAGVGLEDTRFPSVLLRDLLFGGLAGLLAGGMQVIGTAWRQSRAPSHKR